jgi:hypothetical protein
VHRPRHLIITAAAVSLGALVAGCGTDPGPVSIDLREPTSVADLDPDARTFDLKSYDGPADFTVQLPERTVSGRFWNVVVYAPILVDGRPVPADEPPPAIDQVELSYENTDDPDVVLERIDDAIATYPDAGAERDELLAFRDTFRAAVDARGGVIDPEDFVREDLTSIYTFGLQQTEDDALALQVRVRVDGAVDMALLVQLDDGAG